MQQRAHIGLHADGLADIAPERAHAHDQRDDRIKKRRAEQGGHRVMRHQFVERAGARCGVPNSTCRSLQRGKAEDERGDAERGNEADDEPVARERAGEGAGPGIGRVGLRPRHRERLRHIDVEFMRRRELAVGVAGAAGMAEIGEIVEVAVGKRAAHFHRRKHRAQPLAIAAGIADRHQPVGLFQNSRSVHPLLPDLRSNPTTSSAPCLRATSGSGRRPRHCSCPSSPCANCP